MAKRHRPRRANLIAASPLSPQQFSSPTAATPSPPTPAPSETPSPPTPAPSETPGPRSPSEQPAPSSPPPPSPIHTTLPFTNQRPASIPSARRKGPRNKPWTHDTLRTALRIDAATFAVLLETIEPVFTTNPHPTTAGTNPDCTILASLHALSFPSAVTAAVQRAWNGTVDAEPAFYLYHVAMAAKKRVKARSKGKERKTLGSQLIEMRDNIASIQESTQSQFDDIRTEMEGVQVDLEELQTAVDEVQMDVEDHKVQVDAKVDGMKIQFEAKVDALKAVIEEKADALSASVTAQLSDFLLTIGNVVVKK